MVISDKIRERIALFPRGQVFTIADFDIDRQYCGALIKSLNRMVGQGLLQRLSKGKFYKPQQSVFGELPPSEEEVVKDFLEKNGKTIGYITGTVAFAAMGLTTQISSDIVIGTNKYRHPLTRGQFHVSFLVQPNSINKRDIDLYRLLDAIKLIKHIPASTPDEIVAVLGKRIEALENTKQQRLIVLAGKYAPFVRALLGAIMENNGLNAEKLRDGLNAITTYDIGVSTSVLPTIEKWNVK